MSFIDDSAAIGVFDSGVGGLTVVQALKQKLVHESFIYFGDTARLPYGNKSPATILRYSIENSQFLIKKKIKILVVACHTASAFSIHELRKSLNIPVVDVIDAGIQAALKQSENKQICVIGTKGTINSAVYQTKIKAMEPSAEILAIPCPLFVPLVEENFYNHPAARLVIREYLAPLQNTKTDTLLLGCTHYPLLKQLIQNEVGPHIHIVDSSQTCVEMLEKELLVHQLKSKQNMIPTTRYFVSDDAGKFRQLAQEFLGEPIGDVEVVNQACGEGER